MSKGLGQNCLDVHVCECECVFLQSVSYMYVPYGFNECIYAAFTVLSVHSVQWILLWVLKEVGRARLTTFYDNRVQ